VRLSQLTRFILVRKVIGSKNNNNKNKNCYIASSVLLLTAKKILLNFAETIEANCEQFNP
jgi:hypothetical protein